MKTEISTFEMQQAYHGSLKSYLLGFLVCFCLTCLSFYLVSVKAFSFSHLSYMIIALALTQVIFQLLFFLHLGKKMAPQWENSALFFAVLTLLIVVLGSLWIMYDLNQRVMKGMS